MLIHDMGAKGKYANIIRERKARTRTSENMVLSLSSLGFFLVGADAISHREGRGQDEGKRTCMKEDLRHGISPYPRNLGHATMRRGGPSTYPTSAGAPTSLFSPGCHDDDCNGATALLFAFLFEHTMIVTILGALSSSWVDFLLSYEMLKMD
jgi:hypothetical protein